MNGLDKKILKLRTEFKGWYAASAHHLNLNELSQGKANASLFISHLILTPHPVPMINGLMIATMASMVGVYAVRTLIDDEYPLLKTIRPPKLIEPTIFEENKLLIETYVINNRRARADTIIVFAVIKSEAGRLKAKCIFYYRILAKDLIEPKLKSLDPSLYL
ncbi:hypothetical protein A2662_01615 [Candidatus Giovannonibacteria bacterium RIFCSPHIGHO2_01_FULL_45_33]|uniref:Thioesterase domain-containing protein n=1 Tax=Candidatus Giovannonibacteria bacterium RIFCSPLOWO2_01_FULL_45_34 TaxID=1798351 RepID=A0A1F5X0M9_9BACT|nr:MAG: hypothetical protein A2662_01615 [Candidatus Giovannonibacteria bacterium RIFCSPHIGHO2_01_FULL_45_33]OGF81420.1 MAG: hypothetical protein A2930_01330 [Candidatus Giovannonibacteria bacterium RIFCSPLOWO2_01_FULL_45_34]